MGIRDKLIGRVKRVVERLNGDFSAVAPEQTQDYDKPVVPGGQEVGLGSQNLRPKRRHVPGGAPSLRSS